ncbi:hypothetical protein ma154 [Moumouvirus australiensis]|uniref:Uncharacterized protein n=1 Tax=Moumouvirus australiensis TaxID=2109587 RepID=A0A2P1EKY8_9VIRU|nr:hypothetical protein QKC55_gp750 [Moumouvirus australiensis]AVL94540.1 hypothetical protein ma154 [Moumouvirus australiensis]
MSHLSFLTTEILSEWQYDCSQLAGKIRHVKLTLYENKDVKTLSPEEYSKIANEYTKLDEFEKVILNLSELDNQIMYPQAL